MKNSNKIRLDILLYNLGLFDSREKAKIAIMEGNVYVNNQKEDKPGTLVNIDSKIEYKNNQLKYVSRGGYKLEKAIKCFNIDLNNKICLDIGASTGGFTDCMLKNNAKFVYAIDCGTNQLDYKLRINEKVYCLENFNARYLTLDDINNEKVDFVTIDVSFISLKKVLLNAYNCSNDDATIVALIKPQFEAGREKVNKGIIVDKKIHIEVINDIIDFCLNNNMYIKNLTFSPIKGQKGNIEFLIYISKSKFDNILDLDKLVVEVVSLSHNEL